MVLLIYLLSIVWGNQKVNVTVFSFFRPLADFVIGTCLACSAYILAKFVSRVTGRKPNTCLVVWHVLNVFVHVALFATYQLFFLFGV